MNRYRRGSASTMTMSSASAVRSGRSVRRSVRIRSGRITCSVVARRPQGVASAGGGGHLVVRHSHHEMTVQASCAAVVSSCGFG